MSERRIQRTQAEEQNYRQRAFETSYHMFIKDPLYRQVIIEKAHKRHNKLIADRLWEELSYPEKLR